MTTSAPKTIGEFLDALYQAREARLELAKQQKQEFDALKEREEKLRDQILRAFTKAELENATGKLATGSITRTSVPVIEDWDALSRHIRKTGELDLLNKALNRAAVRERWEARVAVPGVGTYTDVELSLTKARKKTSATPPPTTGKRRSAKARA